MEGNIELAEIDVVDVEGKPKKGETEGHDHQIDWKFVATVAAFQIGALIFFAIAADYEDATGSSGQGTVSSYYAMYQDVHVMIFVGFGLLMTFLRKHAFNSMGMTFLIGVFSIQLGIMFNTIMHNMFFGHKVEVTMDIPTLITGDFAAGAVLISYGAVLGRVNPTQILWMLFFELIFYAINETIGAYEFEAVDMGGSMFVHTFGAYFGLAFSAVWGAPTEEEAEEEASVYHSDIFAMIGTVFLWMYWPSFNGALAGEAHHAQERVVINTVLSLSASCAASFLWSHVLNGGKLDMVHIQNASLAGGVAIGSSSDLVVGPYASILIGMLAGSMSTAGYVFLTPRLNNYVYDVCGVHNLHGLPGILGGMAGAISAAAATSEAYGENITEVFAARDERTASEQGAFQAYALLLSLSMAIVGGAVSAFLVDKIEPKRKANLFNDKNEWEVPTQEFGESYFEMKNH